jgi:hypothetical protein
MREIASQFGWCKGSDLWAYQHTLLSLALVSEEEKEAIFPLDESWYRYGPADCSTELIPPQDGPWLIIAGSALVEEIVGVKIGITQVVESGAMKIVSARFGNYSDYSSIAASVLGGLIVGNHAEFRDCVGVGVHHGNAVCDGRVIPSVEEVRSCFIPSSGDGKLPSGRTGT